MNTMIRRHPRPELLPERQILRAPLGTEWEIREATSTAGAPVVELEGYAAVFNYEYEMYGGPPYGWIERILPGAFDETLAEKPDVVFVVNHEGLPLARTRSETLSLTIDDHGLLMGATLDASDPDVSALVPKIRRRDVTEMSFAFRVLEQIWRQHDDWPEDEEYPPARDLVKVNINRGDVSVVTFGASDATEIDFRAAVELFGQVAADDPERALVEMRSAGWDEDLLQSVIEAVRRDAHGDTGVTENVTRDGDDGGGMPLALALHHLDD